MRHALMYAGGFERNFRKLTPTSTSFEGSDGQSHEYPAWPAGVDGLRVYFMEKAGKKFCAVRIADAESDVPLENEMVLVPGQHFGFATRLSGEPTVFDDDSSALKLLEDAIKKNASASTELFKIRARLKSKAAAAERPASG